MRKLSWKFNEELFFNYFEDCEEVTDKKEYYDFEEKISLVDELRKSDLK